jgi:hypothetical protein
MHDVERDHPQTAYRFDDVKWNVVVLCIFERKVCAPSSHSVVTAL